MHEAVAGSALKHRLICMLVDVTRLPQLRRHRYLRAELTARALWLG